MTAVPTVVITGVSGFVGHWMARLLQTEATVVGLSRKDEVAASPAVRTVQCDLQRMTEIQAAIRTYRPNYVIHLAGISDAKTAHTNPLHAVQANAWSTLNLLEAVRLTTNRSLRGVLIAGSIHEYNMSCAEEIDLTESHPCSPGTTYGWSKFIQSSLAQMYGKQYDLPVVCVRTTNLVGPGSRGVCSELIRQVVQIENGTRSVSVQVGNPSVVRDFLDVRDAVRAYWALLHSDFSPGDVFNVCRGVSHSLTDVLRMIQQYTAIPFLKEIEVMNRHSTPPVCVRCNAARIQAATGWRPSIDLTESLYDMMECLRKKESRIGTSLPQEGGEPT